VELREALRTTGSAREFLPDPVPAGVLYRLLDDARFAGSGGNRQGWRVIIVGDGWLRTQIRDLYRPSWDRYMNERRRGVVPFSAGSRLDGDAPPPRAPNQFVDHLDTVPVLLLVCVELAALAITDRELPRQSIVGGASIYPFVQNLLLAAAVEGLGGVLTTLVCPAEPDLRKLFAIPDSHAVAALVALGYPTKRLTKLTRHPPEAFATIDRFDGQAFGPA
jgi:nitroreductase